MAGYSGGGASLDKKTLKSWRPLHLSAKSDIDKNLHTLRNRAADLAVNSPLGAAIISTLTAGVIGSGLKLFPRVRADVLKLTASKARALNQQIKREFYLWAAECDYLRRNNFYELQRITFQSSLVDGDSFCLFKRRRPNNKNPYSLRLQAVEGLRISNPLTEGALISNVEMMRGENRIINGIEFDSDGAMTAIWISNRVWNEVESFGEKLSWQRILCYGEESGCRNVLMISHDTRPDQSRGVPILSPVVESLKQMSRYADAELSAAIVRSFFSLFFVQPASNLDMSQVAGEDFDINSREFSLTEPSITALPRGVSVETVNNSDSASSFDSFFSAFIRQVAAAVNLPYEVLLKNFQSSYSASRAALLQAEQSFKIRRAGFIQDFLQPIYEMFLEEAVALGRIDFPDFDDPIKRQAFMNALWLTEGKGSIDEVKDANAAKLRLEIGLSTREIELARLGYDIDDMEV